MAKSTDKPDPRLQRLCVEMILISIGLIYAALFWTWHVGMQANNVDHTLFHASENLKGIRKHVKIMEARLR